ncbi:FUSC family protein [Actinomadura verrucosospora]|uniref:Membrane protein n=1 Tax=Actinomadura verrucosospora TaxID=46165 RepID=A0A7D3VVA2_ACTVE|nr:FUSC family protein [Actinomadura verrucosospora]QKG23960.1 membrane protein [Actinomadura verrucosospora]
MLKRARSAYAQINGQSAPFYGLAAALAMAIPLLVGSLTGRAAQGSMIALGAYLVALRAPEGPYGNRARDLASGVLMVAIGSAVGGLLSGHTWPAVIVVPPLIALGVAVPRIGSTAGLAVLLSAIRPPSADVIGIGLLELIGGLLTMGLLLVPWPVRRLRPLREALADAADRVAEALDAVAQDVGAPDPSPLDAVELTNPDLLAVTRMPDWEERRRAASEALTDARAVYGLYRSGRGRGEPTRPERLIDALGRVLHETVTLQAVLEAAKNYPPDREWELETQTAVSALAARLRLLAGAIATNGEAPLGGEESAAVRRMGRLAEQIRRAGLAGDEDLIAVSLIGQVRRSIDRIAGETSSARRTIAAGLRIGIGPPRMPGPPDPRTALDRMRRAVRTRSPLFRQITRVYVTAVVSMSLAGALHIPHGHWLTITAMLSLRATYGETVERLVQRVGGTAAGSVVAAVVLTLAPTQRVVAVIVFVFALAGFALRPINFAYWGLFGTPLAMMLLDFSAPSDWSIAGERIGLVAGGTVLSFLAVRLLWPAGHVERLPVQLGRMLSVHADLVRAAADVVGGERVRLPQEKVVTAERSAEAVAETGDRLRHERLPDTELIGRLRDAVRAAHRVRDHLIAVSRVTREEAVDAGPVPEILDRLADQLEEAAGLLDDPGEDLESRSPAAELEEELADLDAYLKKLTKRRRAEIKSGVGREEFTPLRHALLQVSGTRYAVRSLRRDTGRVINASLAAVGQGSEPEPEAEPEPVSPSGPGT